MTKKELKELIKEVISEETQSVDPEEILGNILELTISDTSDPLLILIDKNYTEIEHKIRLKGLYPTQDEQYNAYEETSDLFSVSDITINF